MDAVITISVNRSCWLPKGSSMILWYKYTSGHCHFGFPKIVRCGPTHARLLKKIDHNWIRDAMHCWIRAFLAQRTQSAQVNGSHSSKVLVESGVSQGTVPGPLLFLLYNNDFPKCVSSHVTSSLRWRLLHRPIRSITDELQLQEDLNALTIWTNTWVMLCTPSKCYILTTSQDRRINTFLYYPCGCVLSKISTSKYLGVTLRDDL